jgi:hypothetical protein
VAAEWAKCRRDPLAVEVDQPSGRVASPRRSRPLTRIAPACIGALDSGWMRDDEKERDGVRGG